MVNRCSKFLHFGRKSWGEFEKPTPEVPILSTVCHLDSICGVFQQTLISAEIAPFKNWSKPDFSHSLFALSSNVLISASLSSSSREHVTFAIE